MGNRFPLLWNFACAINSPSTGSFLKGGEKILSDKKILRGDFGREEPFEREKSALDDIIENSRSQLSKADCVETIKYDENGNVIVDMVRKSKSQNGSGFVISYTAKMCDFIAETKQGSIVRLFLYLAHNQQYGTDEKTYGYRCSHKFLQQVLGLDRKSVYNALSFLKDKFLVLETREEGSPEFMVNPNYVTIGTDKKKRLAVWNKRWADFWKSQAQKS